MRICVSGASGVGKSKFIKDFLSHWNSYSYSGDNFKEFIKKEKLPPYKKANQESQNKILDFFIDEAMKYKKTDNIIHDAGSIDNLVYTLHLKAKNNDAIDDNFIQKTFQLVKQSMYFYDVIFYIPYNDQYMTDTLEKNKKDDKIFNSEIDNFFKSIISMYYDKNEYLFPFNTDDGVPALIEIFGNSEERLEIAKLYIDSDGKGFGEEDSLISNFLNPEELEQFAKIINNKNKKQ